MVGGHQMERDEALCRLNRLLGRNLHELAREYEVTVLSQNGKVNKGWAGHVCERYLGLPINSSQSPNFGSWELKSVPLKRNKNGQLVFKETMQITMIDEYNVRNTAFEESHLLSKLRKAIIVARIVGDSYDMPTYVHSITAFDLSESLFNDVKADYVLVQECISRRGFEALTGHMGVYIQPRTKGAGHGSTSRAFYARKLFLSQFIDLSEST